MQLTNQKISPFALIKLPQNSTTLSQIDYFIVYPVPKIFISLTEFLPNSQSHFFGVPMVHIKTKNWPYPNDYVQLVVSFSIIYASSHG